VLFDRLKEHAAFGRPYQIGLIGAGTFGAQIARQIVVMTGLQLAAIADLRVDRARDLLGPGGVAVKNAAALRDAVASGTPAATDSAEALVSSDGDGVVEATGRVETGIAHGLLAIMAGKHLAMVTVEADVVAGYYLRKMAEAAGVIYGLAYGDEPSLAAELVDWAQTLGFRVVAAGKGTRFTPAFRKLNPDDVPRVYGFTGSDYNAQMFGSFLDGTKHAIECCALANATGLGVDVRGMHFPTADLREIPDIIASRDKGGVLAREGVVEAVSSIDPQDRPVERSLGAACTASSTGRLTRPSTPCLATARSPG